VPLGQVDATSDGHVPFEDVPVPDAQHNELEQVAELLVLTLQIVLLGQQPKPHSIPPEQLKQQ
jgi:hypothetical protein